MSCALELSDYGEILDNNFTIGEFQQIWRKMPALNLIFFFSRYMQQIFSLGQRIQRFEDLLKGQDVLEKLEQLEQKMHQIQDDAKNKFEELNNKVADISARISSTETLLLSSPNLSFASSWIWYIFCSSCSSFSRTSWPFRGSSKQWILWPNEDNLTQENLL